MFLGFFNAKYMVRRPKKSIDIQRNSISQPNANTIGLITLFASLKIHLKTFQIKLNVIVTKRGLNLEMV